MYEFLYKPFVNIRCFVTPFCDFWMLWWLFTLLLFC